ncbi:hypothetical protein HMF8227_00226 [Saliniradius amylolyticus]|uniref:HTH luxR-type domain-containing protein n=1 Tax=Saliniradius amylolyticus TaxID=2183582 RepID=A0A2S2DZB1_9ALTE|nr:helix-turn-helix transcriptional regulator [Saliniradius amylolyticus]AWL10734.1 hypothetical protein HMF8227_00226 [Saliniradius amylolyticus]
MNLAIWSEQLLRLSGSVGGPKFYPHLASLLQLLGDFDELLILRFNTEQPPELRWQSQASEGDNLTLYLDKAYVLDPFYKAGAHQGQQGFFRLQALIEDGERAFQDYYNSYFRYLKVVDEMGYLIQTESGFIHIEFANFEDNAGFSAELAQQLHELFPLIDQLVVEHEGCLTQSNSPQALDARRHAVLIDDFQRLFASSVCTPREHEVVLLMLQGYPVKTIARQLECSLETVKMHRKKIYVKLGIGSQPELLALFIDILAGAVHPITEDPVLSYLEHRGEVKKIS